MILSWLYDYETWLYDNWYPFRIVSPLIGYDQAKASTESNNEQIAYSQYMSTGNQRAMQDWYRNVGSKGRTIRYPELSYPGAVRGYSAGIARANLANYSSDANLYRNTVYGTAGLYGVAGRIARSL